MTEDLLGAIRTIEAHQDEPTVPTLLIINDSESNIIFGTNDDGVLVIEMSADSLREVFPELASSFEQNGMAEIAEQKYDVGMPTGFVLDVIYPSIENMYVTMKEGRKQGMAEAMDLLADTSVDSIETVVRINDGMEVTLLSVDSKGRLVIEAPSKNIEHAFPPIAQGIADTGQAMDDGDKFGFEMSQEMMAAISGVLEAENNRIVEQAVQNLDIAQALAKGETAVDGNVMMANILEGSGFTKPDIIGNNEIEGDAPVRLSQGTAVSEPDAGMER